MVAGPLFLISVAGYIYARIALKPDEEEIDETYYECEDQLPSVRRQNNWQQITLTAACVAALLLFIAIAI